MECDGLDLCGADSIGFLPYMDLIKSFKGGGDDKGQQQAQQMQMQQMQAQLAAQQAQQQKTLMYVLGAGALGLVAVLILGRR